MTAVQYFAEGLNIKTAYFAKRIKYILNGTNSRNVAVKWKIHRLEYV